MIYKSDNGYTGTFKEGNFCGFKHYDLTIFDPEGKFVFHATYTEPITYDDLKDEVDNYPEFLKELQKLN